MPAGEKATWKWKCIFIEYKPGSVGSLGDGSKPVSGGLCPPQEDSLLPLQHIENKSPADKPDQPWTKYL
jgi:hypothetical protein